MKVITAYLSDDGRSYDSEEEALEADRWYAFRELLKSREVYGSVSIADTMELVKEHLTFKK